VIVVVESEWNRSYFYYPILIKCITYQIKIDSIINIQISANFFVCLPKMIKNDDKNDDPPNKTLD